LFLRQVHLQEAAAVQGLRPDRLQNLGRMIWPPGYQQEWEISF
jgi:hypothetical protein